MNGKEYGLRAAGMGTVVLLAVCSTLAFAKLPPPTDEQKAKAEESKAKAAETAKRDAELLGKAQDRVAERYIHQMKAKGIDVKPTPIAPPAPAPAPAAPAPTASATPAAPPAAAKK
ncbi:MAG TPA: hypothetical protein PLT94_10610 [Rhodocyclaceae bacterium]|nr:hypothetical protein [Rhodocyclaceae bacterium]